LITLLTAVVKLTYFSSAITQAVMHWHEGYTITP